MDGIPPEVLDRVFQFACTDDGSTGRSLSAVSSRIRDISSPHKYYSLHVSDQNRLARFAFFLEGYHAPVQYLKLDCTVPNMKLPAPIYLVSATYGREGPEFPDVYRSTSLHAKTLKMISNSVGAVLSVLGPTLRGLYLIVGPRTAPLKLDFPIFPLLDNLFLSNSVFDALIAWDSSHFPVLTKLDISCDTGRMLYGPTSGFDTLTNLPSLTHFGCCPFGQGAVWNFLCKLKDAIKRGTTAVLKDVPDLDKYLRLDELRIRLPCAYMPGLLKMIDHIGTMAPEEFTFPPITARGHVEKKEEILHMEEWRYVVEGGQGFSSVPSQSRHRRDDCN